MDGLPPDSAVSYFLDLRLRLRGNPAGLALVDRCLLLIALAQTADAATLGEIRREVEGLADDLALRFGAPQGAVLQ